MTLVHISLRRDDDDGLTPAEGSVWCEPTTRREDGTSVVLAQGFAAALVAGEVTVELAPTGLTWCWHIIERTGWGTERYVSVPDSAGAVEYTALQDVDPATLVAWSPADPEAAYLAALDNLARTLTAHSHTLADVTDAGDAAGLDVGTTAGTVMAGDDSRVTSLPSTYVARSAPTILDVQTIDTADARALRYWRTALANRNARRANMLHLGDSITWGHQAPSDPGDPSIARRWTSVLRDTMRARFPTSPATAGGWGFISPNGASLIDNPVTTTGTVTFSATYGLDLKTATLGSTGATLTVAFTGTGIDFNYLQMVNANGYFSWAVDGGTATVISTNGPSDNSNVIGIRGLTPGAHTLVITRTGTAFSFITGFYVYNGDESSGIGSWTAGWSGSKVSQWNAAPNWMDDLTWAAPDLMTIEFGANEYVDPAPVSSATFKANLQTMITGVRTKLGYSPSIVLIPVWALNNGTNGNPETWAPYRAAMYEVAAADPTNVCVWDAGVRVQPGSTFVNDTAGGLLSPYDKAHPTDVGHRYMAEALAQFISPR